MPASVVAMLLGVLVSIGFLAYIDSQQQTDRRAKIDVFVDRCQSKGGVVLESHRMGSKWIGCFDVKEIPNEEE